MKHRYGVMFWLLLLVSAALPSAAQTTVKKQLYQADVWDTLSVGDTKVGQAMLIVRQSGYEYMVRDNYYALRIDRVTLEIAGDPGGRNIVLCDDSGGPPCDGIYPLDLEGTLTASMLQLAENGPVTAQEFHTALASGLLTIAFNDGDFGSGRFVRIF